MSAEDSRERELATATLGGGCFWCIEAVMVRLGGVEEVESGYSGGTVHDPTYEQVCAGDTGHIEVVRVRFDPERISYRDLLEVFFTVHDPTTLDRQGADVGHQYRSVIFYHDEEQRQIAESTIGELEARGLWDDPVVTELRPAERFFPAEEHHQDYFARNPGQPYCQVVVAPKVAKLRSEHADKLEAP